jgi:hypothetical protein
MRIFSFFSLLALTCLPARCLTILFLMAQNRPSCRYSTLDGNTTLSGFLAYTSPPGSEALTHLVATSCMVQGSEGWERYGLPTIASGGNIGYHREKSWITKSSRSLKRTTFDSQRCQSMIRLVGVRSVNGCDSHTLADFLAFVHQLRLLVTHALPHTSTLGGGKQATSIKVLVHENC